MRTDSRLPVFVGVYPREAVDLLIPFLRIGRSGDMERGNMLGLNLGLQLQHVRLQCHW